MKHEGYKKRKLELEATKRHRNEDIDEEVYEGLVNLLKDGNMETVHKALYDGAYRINPDGEMKTKPGPLNLSYEEIHELDRTLENALKREYNDEERYKTLRSIRDKTRNAKP